MKFLRYKKAFLVLAIVMAVAVLAEMVISICGVIIVDPVIVATTVLLFCLAQTLYRNAAKAIDENNDLTDSKK